MLKHLMAAAVLAALVLVAGGVGADDATALKSGPQVNQQVPGPFHPLNVTGANAGEKFCLFCVNGQNPVAMVFARECNPNLVKLIKRLDQATAKNSEAKMGSFVVFLSDEEGLNEKLKGVAQKEGLKNIVLSIDNPAGPQQYQVAKDADVTVVLYTDRTVKANHSFRRGQLNEAAIDRVVADVTKIVPRQ